MSVCRIGKLDNCQGVFVAQLLGYFVFFFFTPLFGVICIFSFSFCLCSCCILHFAFWRQWTMDSPSANIKCAAWRKGGCAAKRINDLHLSERSICILNCGKRGQIKCSPLPQRSRTHMLPPGDGCQLAIRVVLNGQNIIRNRKFVLCVPRKVKLA